MDESVINYELLAKLLEHIAVNGQEGAILVFCPGMAEITKAIDEMRRMQMVEYRLALGRRQLQRRPRAYRLLAP